MKHFLILIHYRIPAEQMGEVVQEHRAYLQAGYQQGMLLMSGPRSPRTGGVVVARAPALEDVQAFFQNDPYQLHGAADYEFIEFIPLFHQDFLKEWVA